MPDQPAILRIRRDAANDAKARTVIIKLDGVRKAVLDFGASIDLEVEPGEHQLMLDNTWATRRMDLSFEAGKTYEFITGNTAGGCSMFFLAFTGAATMGLIWQPADSSQGCDQSKP